MTTDRPLPAVVTRISIGLLAGLLTCTSAGSLMAGSIAAAGTADPADPNARARSSTWAPSSPVADALAASPTEVRIYNEHVTTLANPFFEGRVPGSRGIELAAEYIQWHFERVGLEPAFESIDVAVDGTELITPRSSHRQRFEYGNESVVVGAELAFRGPGGSVTLRPDEDFIVTSLGSDGEVDGPLAFVGYSIEDGPDGYSSYPGDVDLEGHVALMLRFEPMDKEGRSLWSDVSRWSGAAGFAGKLQAAADRGASAIVVVNTPGANDPRVEALAMGSRRRPIVDVPVLLMSPQAANRLVEAADDQGRSILAMRRAADVAGAVEVLGGGRASVRAETERVPSIAENVGGLLPGRGVLADELVVVGAHYDHIGMGNFGSRSSDAGRLIHAGADDNASGTAGLLLIAENMADLYSAMPADQPARSILFVAFSAEESGLHGSRHYVSSPITAIEDHVLMINFDMIGRIAGNGLSVSGLGSAEGLEDWVGPHLDAAPLPVQRPEGISGRSDHAPFHSAGIPILFAIIADLHEDYHTPGDVSEKINRIGAVQTVDLFTDILLEAVQRDERLVFSGERDPGRRSGGGPTRAGIKVRFGIAPGAYESSSVGVLVGSVYDDTSAAAAGIQEGDRLMTWNGRDIEGVAEWMGMLGEHEPGDVVSVGVEREGEMIEVEVTLLGRDDVG